MIKFAHGSEGDSSFLTDNNVFSVGAFSFSDFFGGSAHVGVESAAETSIGTADEDQVGAWGVGLALVDCGDGAGGRGSESSDGSKVFGGLGVLGSGNHVHGFGNFLDVGDRFNSDVEFLKFTGGVSNRFGSREGGGDFGAKHLEIRSSFCKFDLRL